MQTDVAAALSRLEGGGAFDIIFMDPPYRLELEREALAVLSDSSLAGEQTQIIVEASLETDFSYLEEMGFEIEKYKKYKTNAHVFIRKRNRGSEL